MDKKHRSITEISPSVRFAGYVTVHSANASQDRIAYDHRLFLTVGRGCDFTVAGQTLRLGERDLLLIRSGTPYRPVPGAEGCRFLIVNFDFFGEATAPDLPGNAMALPFSSVATYREENRVETFLFEDGFLGEGFALMRDAGEAAEELQALFREASRAEVLCVNQMRAYLTLVLNRIYRRVRVAQPYSRKSNANDVLAWLSEHLDEPLTNESVAAHFHYHPNYLSSLLRAGTGMPLHRYLLHLRIRRATELLLSSTLPVAEVARLSGFSDAAYFTQYFRRVTGSTPTEFRGGV